MRLGFLRVKWLSSTACPYRKPRLPDCAWVSFVKTPVPTANLIRPANAWLSGEKPPESKSPDRPQGSRLIRRQGPSFAAFHQGERSYELLRAEGFTIPGIFPAVDALRSPAPA